MKFSEKTRTLFRLGYEKLKPFHSLLNNYQAVIAYSGGKDSTLLSYLYLYLHSEKLCPEPILFHLDHSIRDNQSQENQIIKSMNVFSSKNIVKKKNIPKISNRIKKSLEETGRLVRYKYLKKIASEVGGYITTGHHTDDYIETFLINLIRGSGYSNFTSLPIYKNKIFRPLVVFSEEERSLILETMDLEVFEDESNQSEKYLRNRLRLNIIPLLKKEGLNSKKIYDNFHDQGESLEEFDSIRNTKIQTIPSYLTIDKNFFKGISIGNLKQILDIYAGRFELHSFSKSIVLEVQKELLKESSFQIENKEIILWKNPSSDLYLIPKSSPALKVAKEIIRGNQKFIVWNQNEFEILQNYSLGEKSLGMKILHNGRHKEISELFREAQIPTPVRKFIPILFEQNKPIVLLFNLFSSRVKNQFSD